MTSPALVTTVAASTANSYATVAEADVYLCERGASGWDDLSNEQKVRKLIQAARLIDKYPFDGYPYNTSTARAGYRSGQALAFPRSTDVDGLGDPYVPEEVKEAQIEVALALATSREAVAPSAPALQSLSLGSMSATFTSAESTVDSLIRQLIGHRIVSSVRMD